MKKLCRKMFTIKGRDALETLVKLRDELDTLNDEIITERE